MDNNFFHTSISHHIWDTKYRYRKDGEIVDQTPDDTWRRIAHALASIEKEDAAYWEQAFYNVLSNLQFLPGGRIIAGAGTDHKVTLFNCFVMGMIQDSIPSIFENLKEGALTMQQGGGIGYDFSTLRPEGSLAKSSNNVSSGPVSFMKIWDTMCATMLSIGARRGAMMATLRCDHPDIMAFVTAKQTPETLKNFNLSVMASDSFMEAVNKDTDWPLVFPAKELSSKTSSHDRIIHRQWSGTDGPIPCKVVDTIRARALWKAIMNSTYNYAEPGILFIDRINEQNNLSYYEQISATNPCGEVPLPPYGACNLGSLNLTQFVRHPFSNNAKMNMEELRKTVQIAVRLLDNVIDASQFPLNKQQVQAQDSRRIGLGIMGLADTLIMLGLHYGSAEGRQTAATIMKTICHTAYPTSV
ncbi:adenosylcobalamin-dependent ribonucleoside-diphosphate reductase [Fodinibius salsisoli]|uniref:adenosylcobalamin-dependent ribonucleoside-diphosphate reductase n=1 Tax=Fodinibius salsisoli TaxID=2820877 RepID=UPI0022486EAC|nr:adenosylcobalamin-dependent ribonucleoside-diphosphate reductase [Fodinibius salsisoli]